jgi:CRP-like cAMP-binding protein
MIDQLIARIKMDKENESHFQDSFEEKEVPSKTVLLHDGEVSNYIYFIRKGCLRQWFNKEGKDIIIK